MDTKRIAEDLLAALDEGKTISSIVARNPGFDWDEGYAVSAEILRLRRARGERTPGRKIGFTNRNIWAEYGATAPIWAHVYDTTLDPRRRRPRDRLACAAACSPVSSRRSPSS